MLGSLPLLSLLVFLGHAAAVKFQVEGEPIEQSGIYTADIYGMSGEYGSEENVKCNKDALCPLVPGQYHRRHNDSKGVYYEVETSRKIAPCTLTEDPNLLLDTLPPAYQPGQPAVLPCLVRAIPTTSTQLFRCGDESCEEMVQVVGKRSSDVTGMEIDVTGVESDVTGVESDVIGAESDVIRTGSQHFIIANATEQDTGWYRCRARNECGGELLTSPFYLNVSAGAEISKWEVGHILSPRTTESSFSEEYDQNYQLYDKIIMRNLTEYELWQMNTSFPSYTDEVMFLGSDESMMYHCYPLFQVGHGQTFTESTLNGYSDCNYYASRRFENSYKCMFSNRDILMKFQTRVLPDPNIGILSESSHIFIPARSPSLSFTFTGNIAEEYIRQFRCFRNGIPLVTNSWRVSVEVEEIGGGIFDLVVRINTPRDTDSGYYQCGVMYQDSVFYISPPLHVTVESGVGEEEEEEGRAVNVTETSATLTWDHPPAYTGPFLLFVSSLPTLTNLSRPSVSLTSLTPYKQYTWWAATLHQSPLTNRLSFRTASAPPRAANISSGVAVTASETSLMLTWAEVPRELWYDETLFYLVSVVTSPSSAVSSSVTSSVTSSSAVSSSPREERVYSGYVLLSGLKMATQYNITVTPMNSVGAGPATRLTARTKHRELKVQPRVVAVESSRSSVRIVVPNGPPNASLLLEIFTDNLCFFASEKPSSELIKLRSDRLQISELSSFSTYSIRVHATNGYSTSPWSDCLTIRTAFNWSHVITPLSCVFFVITLLVTVRAIVRTRCPDIVSRIKQALEPSYANIFSADDGVEWEVQSGEVTIVHTAHV